MPLNKHAGLRYRILDSCLCNGKKWERKNLIQKIDEVLIKEYGAIEGVSLRTFYEDIKLMRSPSPAGFDAPIECKNGCYFYNDPKYSIFLKPLSERDIESIKKAINILSQFKNLPIFENLEEILLKIEGKINLHPYDDTFIDFGFNENVKGLQFIKPFYNTIIQKKTINVTYKPFDAEKAEKIIISPYFLRNYNQRWFLIGLNHEVNKYWVLGLDRIVSFDVINRKHIPHNEDINLHFSNIIGVTVPEKKKTVNVVLKFKTKRAAYVMTKPVHATQKILERNEKFTSISLKIIPNKELMALLLSFAGDIEIIKPVSLRKHYFALLKKALKAGT
ncbi:MAG: hypothetical protein A2275_02675 [Bacteroidetes bacterium RIFOXYA12_FULL_35_11]|nr:MAG: hypothetical protein A2X01_07085 [Bacteroidetes bacterium GWF2_35_48]OFY82105.1 MAG: hypothetical protein A2275_02675 [Bacteroidetes bacterium RIFOXYA12_FULL_35_11]OFY93303.1 MAG: hypothetical protein A2491_15480 [Bacteroidetes bacterium RIFOXYC12_FULL_35_7]HBX53150.1 hypothetical protein [Bacteroidales bacterium]